MINLSRGLRPLGSLLLAAVFCLLPAAAWAEGGIDTGDTAWLMVSCALVLFMTPGLALFYGGMVRSKNILGTLMHSFFAMGIMTIQWVVIGYSLAFSEGNWFVGGFDYMFLEGVGPEPDGDATYPHNLFMLFQGMFAIITPALISGALAERIKFSAYAIFIVLWGTLVYDPVCHWVWGPGGWLLEDGALDFAGGTVVHINSGIAALVFAVVLGRRIGYPHQSMKPHNLGLTVLGAGMLWFGWFGFNAGSALAADGAAANAFTVTHIAAAAATVSWCLIEAIHRGKASVLGAASGAVAGLVAITPACGSVGPMGALIIGLLGGLICYGGVLLKGSLGYDDSLDAFGVHGIGGAWGAIATGIFAVEAIAGTPGLVEGGNWPLMWIQVKSVLATIAYSGVVTFAIVFVLDKTIGIRINEEDERTGLDLAAHGETGYDI